MGICFITFLCFFKVSFKNERERFPPVQKSSLDSDPLWVIQPFSSSLLSFLQKDKSILFGEVWRLAPLSSQSVLPCLHSDFCPGHQWPLNDQTHQCFLFLVRALGHEVLLAMPSFCTPGSHCTSLTISFLPPSGLCSLHSALNWSSSQCPLHDQSLTPWVMWVTLPGVFTLYVLTGMPRSDSWL